MQGQRGSVDMQETSTSAYFVQSFFSQTRTGGRGNPVLPPPLALSSATLYYKYSEAEATRGSFLFSSATLSHARCLVLKQPRREVRLSTKGFEERNGTDD